MRKPLLLLLTAVTTLLIICFTVQHYFKSEKPVVLHLKNHSPDGDDEEDIENEDGILQAQEQEFIKTRDIQTNTIPRNRLISAYSQLMIERKTRRDLNTLGLTWTERGPYADAAGAFSNPRPTGLINSGRIRAILVDKADATNKTVWVGGIDGGLWKTTNITSSPATWNLVNDFFGNLGISSICQDPTNTNIMYFGTGEKTANGDKVRGGGIWKSTNHGVSWALIPNTSNFYNVSKILCDASGYVYVATVSSGNGILRSIDGGTNWTNITPTGLSTRVTEMELSSTGRLHIVCGYLDIPVTGNTGSRYTDVPSTVTSGSWTAPATPIGSLAYNTEFTVNGNSLYALASDANNETPIIYKSTDGGANWAATTTSPSTGIGSNSLSSGQGWYCLALAVDPSNANNVIAGGLNCYRSINGGTSWSQVSSWATTTAGGYVHADQHIITWNGSQVLVGCDGGIFYSSDGGATFSDRNSGLRIKQFYSCAIHPATTNYFLAGAQDNGVQQLSSAGLNTSTEVTGGDGGFVHIDQDEPQYQFGSYTFGVYQRSTDAGSTWSTITNSSTAGSFINPFDYDDGNNLMYTASNPGTFVRWNDPQTGSSFSSIAVSAFGTGTVSHVHVSPYTNNRVFFGTDKGKIVMADNAHTSSPAITDITGSGMLAWTVSCVATGTDDNNLIATFSNYGASHVWISTTGGGTSGWTNISGNLPDIPVRWAMYLPDDNTKAMVATDLGVYETSLINGASTNWVQNASLPVVRTDMLQYRKSDGTIAAATHGRGLWTTSISPTAPYIRFAEAYQTKSEATSGTSGCNGYTDYTINMTIDQAPAGTATATLSVAAGGTATQGIDYDFTTNGSFATPSTAVTFANGSTAAHSVTIRVYDDAAIENTESFTLNYTLSGTTNAQTAPSCQTFTLNIKDNDAAPSPGSAATIGSFTYALGSSTGAPLFDASAQYQRTEILYNAAELTAMGLSAGSISKIGFYLNTKNSTRSFTNLQISIGQTTGSPLVSGSILPVTLSSVLTASSFTTTTGWNTFNLTTPFSWDGTSNIVIDICYNNGSLGVANNADIPIGYADGSTSTQANCIFQAGLTCGGSFTGSSTAYSSGIKPIIQFTIGAQVESTLNASKTSSLTPNDDVYYYNSNGNIIARIKSLSAFNYGCSQVVIDRAGTSSNAFWSNVAAEKLMSKTFHVIPTSNNTSGQYTITLYFSAAEKAGWEAATGQSWNNILLVKVKSQISNYTPSTPGPDGAGAVQVVTPIRGTYGSDYTLTYTFTNGFSGFGAGIPGNNPLPVTLIDFKGKANEKSIGLNWTTSNEQNTAFFEIQKSNDGNTFHAIGNQRAAGFSNTSVNYEFTDRNPDDNNYYRLKMMDRDNKFIYSKTVYVPYNSAVQDVYTTNPFHDALQIHLKKNATSGLSIILLNSNGQKILYQVLKPGYDYNIDLYGYHLSNGIYFLQTIIDDRKYYNKLVKN